MYIPECLQMVYFAHQHWKCQVLMGLLNRKVPATQRISKSRDAILPSLLQPAGWDGVQQMHVFLCLFIYCFLKHLGTKGAAGCACSNGTRGAKVGWEIMFLENHDIRVKPLFNSRCKCNESGFVHSGFMSWGQKKLYAHFMDSKTVCSSKSGYLSRLLQENSNRFWHL